MKSIRRWSQVSLRTLLILIGAFALWLGREANRLHRRAEAVRAFTRAGCVVRYQQPDSIHPEIGLNVFPEDYSWQDYFRMPSDLTLMGDHVDDRVIRHLDELPGLQSLAIHVEHIHMTGALLERIRRLKHLKSVLVRGNEFSPEEVESLEGAVAPNCEIYWSRNLPMPLML